MTVGGALHLSLESRFLKCHGSAMQFRGADLNRRTGLLGRPLSSFSSIQDPQSHNLFGKTCSPLRSVPHRYNVLAGRFSAMPNPSKDFSLKGTAIALTGSYKVLFASSPAPQLITAIGIIAFALWGLGPLIRFSRKLFVGSDGNWKKSKTYYIFVSYLQPLLLWAGTILICRAVDPVSLPTEASQIVKQRMLNFVKSLSTVLAFAYCLSSFIQQSQKFFAETNESNDARTMGYQFAGKAVYTAVWVAAVSLFMELLGFPTQKWITAGGLGTVLLTLAGREIFTNFLSSIMIHATRPFIVNDWIQTKIEGYEVSGTVEHVGWWSPTIIRGDDREAVHIPNHKFSVNIVRNLSQKAHWRIKTHLAISHMDANKINNIVADMRKVLAKNPHVEHKRLHRRVFLENINPENQALLILISCFVRTSHFEEYLRVKESVLLDLLKVISHHRARLATPIRTVQKIYGDPDFENIPFAESVYGRAGVGPNRPLLLGSPSRVSAEDKVKSRQPQRGPVEEQATKSTGPSEPKVAPSSEGTVQNGSERQQEKKATLAEASPKSSNKTDSTASAKSDSTDDSREVGLGSKPGGKKSLSEEIVEGEVLSKSQTAPARPLLEDNLVLNMALKGSKETLPIEDGLAMPVAPEAKEFATSRNGNGTSSAKDKKESSATEYPSSTSMDHQRDKDR